MEDKTYKTLFIGLGVGLVISAAVAYLAFKAGEQSIEEEEDEVETKD